MSFVSGLKCVQCGTTYSEGEAMTCPACGPDEGILDVEFDLAHAKRTFTRGNLHERPLSHWRYRELLPVDPKFMKAIPHIGWTPILEAPRLAAALGIARLRLKDEGRSASASFKDRASSVGVARALQEGRTEIACASTGNAASSLAHCGAVAGVRVNIFVSKNVPEGKLAQLLAYGARVFKVMDTYARAYELCNEACARFGWYNRNAAINPYLVEGKKTGGLELAEQCADDPPDWVAASVGDGCSIYGVHKGIRQMREAGLTDWSARVLGVQAELAAPITEAMKTGRLDRSGNGGTYADSIDVPVPRNWRKAVWAAEQSNGAYINVSDEQIMEAVRLTGRLAGVFAEPAAATAVAGIAAARRAGIISEKSSVLAMITGNGLKDIRGALKAVGGPNEVPADLGAIEAIVERDRGAARQA